MAVLASDDLVGRKIKTLGGETLKIVAALTSGYKLADGSKVPARCVVQKGKIFAEIEKVRPSQFEDTGDGYVELLNSAPAKAKPAPKTSAKQAKPAKKNKPAKAAPVKQSKTVKAARSEPAAEYKRVELRLQTEDDVASMRLWLKSMLQKSIERTFSNVTLGGVSVEFDRSGTILLAANLTAKVKATAPEFDFTIPESIDDHVVAGAYEGAAIIQRRAKKVLGRDLYVYDLLKSRSTDNLYVFVGINEDMDAVVLKEGDEKLVSMSFENLAKRLVHKGVNVADQVMFEGESPADSDAGLDESESTSGLHSFDQDVYDSLSDSGKADYVEPFIALLSSELIDPAINGEIEFRTAMTEIKGLPKALLHEWTIENVSLTSEQINSINTEDGMSAIVNIIGTYIRSSADTDPFDGEIEDAEVVDDVETDDDAETDDAIESGTTVEDEEDDLLDLIGSL